MAQIGKGFWYRRRLLVLALLLFFGFSLLMFRFFYIQVIEHEKWTKKAEMQHYFFVKEPFTRGTFLATSVKKGHPSITYNLTIDIKKHHLYIDPKAFDEEIKQEVIVTLQAFCSKNEQQAGHIREQFFKQSRSRCLVRWLEEQEKEQILSWWYPFALFVLAGLSVLRCWFLRKYGNQG